MPFFSWNFLPNCLLSLIPTWATIFFLLHPSLLARPLFMTFFSLLMGCYNLPWFFSCWVLNIGLLVFLLIRPSSLSTIYSSYMLMKCLFNEWVLPWGVVYALDFWKHFLFQTFWPVSSGQAIVLTSSLRFPSVSLSIPITVHLSRS